MSVLSEISRRGTCRWDLGAAPTWPHSFPSRREVPTGPLNLASHSRLPQDSHLVQVGERVGRASLGTAAGPPALGPDSAPSSWAGSASSSLTPASLPQGSCVGLGVVGEAVPSSSRKKVSLARPYLPGHVCEFVLTGGVQMSVWACVCDMNELVVPRPHPTPQRGRVIYSSLGGWMR